MCAVSVDHIGLPGVIVPDSWTLSSIVTIDELCKVAFLSMLAVVKQTSGYFFS